MGVYFEILVHLLSKGASRVSKMTRFVKVLSYKHEDLRLSPEGTHTNKLGLVERILNLSSRDLESVRFLGCDG